MARSSQAAIISMGLWDKTLSSFIGLPNGEEFFVHEGIIKKELDAIRALCGKSRLKNLEDDAIMP